MKRKLVIVTKRYDWKEWWNTLAVGEEDNTLNGIRLEPIMLKNLPIIPS